MSWSGWKAVYRNIPFIKIDSVLLTRQSTVKVTSIAVEQRSRRRKQVNEFAYEQSVKYAWRCDGVQSTVSIVIRVGGRS